MHQCFSAALSSLLFFKIYSQMHSIKTEKKKALLLQQAHLWKKKPKKLSICPWFKIAIIKIHINVFIDNFLHSIIASRWW